MGLVVAVTGAGSGLGRALAVRLAADGTRLLLVGRRAERLLRTREDCLADGGKPGDIVTLPVDLAEPGAAAAVRDAAVAAFDGLDALVNNAAQARFGPLDDTDVDTFVRLLRVDLVAPAALIRCVAPLLRRSRGTVVNVGSIGGLLAVPGRSYYGAAKAGLHHLTRSLARELAPEIRVNAVLPGAVDTEMYDDLGIDDDAVARLRAEMVRTTPLGRMGRPEDVVPWIVMLLGPDATWMTGSLLVVDGGRSC
ncbi:SDR family NAD(P)-dependent oxidoreductase [Plantactinospora siamensis]|uniref:SDR family NAD(P)-dependent oxidoreductase n=1 Tax=Plantactinospora siamensis TaxID=555372 RepID=A0ABV6P4D8_9ACTN